ncbi:MAG: hypothetical protein PHH05_05890 [Syntrophaceticus sp.]|nr:hypothetical protein [Syntrophaceticus sp.]
MEWITFVSFLDQFHFSKYIILAPTAKYFQAQNEEVILIELIYGKWLRA